MSNFNPVPKPKKKVKAAPKPMARGGKKPKEAGRRYEKRFADRYSFKRVLGSGAFGDIDPALKGDVSGEIKSLKLLFELKSWDKVDGRGEKVVTFPLALLDKIAKEAEVLGRQPVFIYHPKNSTDEWAVVKYQWFHDTLTNLMQQIEALEADLLHSESSSEP